MHTFSLVLFLCKIKFIQDILYSFVWYHLSRYVIFYDYVLILTVMYYLTTQTAVPTQIL